MRRKTAPALCVGPTFTASASADTGGAAASPPPPERPVGGPPTDPSPPGRGSLELPFRTDELLARVVAACRSGETDVVR